MAEMPAAQRRSYPLSTYNFRVRVGTDTISFAEVNGLALEHETVTYRHGLSVWEGEVLTRFSLSKYRPVTFKKGIVIGNRALLDWLSAPPEPRTVEISLCDTAGLPAVSWRIARAVPVKLEAPNLAAGVNEVAIETLQVMASGIRLEHVG
jgi:phage tail-like protein